MYIIIYIYIYIYTYIVQVYFQKILVLVGLNMIYSFVRGNALKQFVDC